MQRPCATKGHQRIAPGVDALLHRTAANSIGHIGVDDCQNAKRRAVWRQANLTGEAFNHGLGSSHIKRHGAAQKILRIQTAEHDIRIRHRGQRAAAPIAGGTRHGAGGLRPHAKRPTRIQPCNGTAASADGVDINHWGQQGKARNPGIARRCLSEAACCHNADIGRSAADIKSDQIVAP